MMRRQAVLGLLFVACLDATPSFAEAPKAASGSSTTTPAPRQRIRALLLGGRGDEAQAAIADQLATKLSDDERAAVLELYAVGRAWGWKRPRRVDTPGNDAPLEARSLSAHEWNAALATARDDLSHGALLAAARRLKVLVAYAPDYVDASRAAELRSLAYDALRDDPPDGAASTNGEGTEHIDAAPARRSPQDGSQKVLGGLPWEPRRPLAKAALGLFAAGYGVSVVAALPSVGGVALRTLWFFGTLGIGPIVSCRDGGGDAYLCRGTHGAAALLLPIVGPFLFVAEHPKDSILTPSGGSLPVGVRIAAYASGFAQIAGVGLLVGSIALGNERQYIPRPPAREPIAWRAPLVRLAPLVSGDVLGLTLRVTGL